MNVAIYLRKSRADLEAEKNGEFETLDRHKTTLLELAKDMDLNVLEMKEEIVSGESLVSRPKMLELLKEVELKEYDAVLVMDIDRLGRGGMQDQGVILDTFRNSKTKIITPRKMYDLTDEFDEEYSEFEAFMARKELKIIKRRMMRGRYKSAKNGSYAYANAPFGYDIKKVNSDYILIPNKDAETVKLIYNLYVNYGLGFNKIASSLDESGVKTMNGGKWNPSTISGIIDNIAYIGFVTWQNNNKNEETQTFKGLHEAIIDEEIFNQAKEIRKARHNAPRTKELKNPLAGLLECGVCGKKMIMKKIGSNNNPYSAVCRYKCGNKSSLFEDVEISLIHTLNNILSQDVYEINNKDLGDDSEKDDFLRKNLKNLKSELSELEKQQSTAYDMLERQIYTEEIFLERMNNIKNRILETNEAIENIKNNLKENSNGTEEKIDIIKKVRNVIELYNKLENVQEKNELLKSIIDSIKYYKNNSENPIKLDVTLKIKKS